MKHVFAYGSLLEVTDGIALLDPTARTPATVVTFVSRRQFTDPAHVRAGVVSREYLETISHSPHTTTRGRQV